MAEKFNLLHRIDETTFFFAAFISLLLLVFSSRKELENGILRIQSLSNFLILTDGIERRGNDENMKRTLKSQ